jgi:hypothetical protein
MTTHDDEIGRRFAAALRQHAARPIAPDPDGLNRALARRHAARTRTRVATAAGCVLVVVFAVVSIARHTSVHDHVTTRPAPAPTQSSAVGSGPACQIGNNDRPLTYCGIVMRVIGQRSHGGTTYTVLGLSCQQVREATNQTNPCQHDQRVLGVAALGIGSNPTSYAQALLLAQSAAPAMYLDAAFGTGTKDAPSTLLTVSQDNRVRSLHAMSAQGPTDITPTWQFGPNRVGLLVLNNDPAGPSARPVGPTGTGTPSYYTNTPAQVDGLDSNGHTIHSTTMQIPGTVPNPSYTGAPPSYATCAQQHLDDVPMYLGKTRPEGEALAASRGETLQVVVEDGHTLPAASNAPTPKRVIVVIARGTITNACRE